MFEQKIAMIPPRIKRTSSRTLLGDEQDGESADELEQDEVFRVLQNSRRRNALRVLRTVDSAIDLRTLADRVASLENDTLVENLNENERQCAYVSLYQTHLPQLDTVGAVDFDKDDGTIERTPVANRFDPHFETEQEAAANGLLDRNLADLGRTVRDAGGTTATLVGGVILGATTGPPSLMLLIGAALAFTAMLSGWLVEGVTSLA